MLPNLQLCFRRKFILIFLLFLSSISFAADLTITGPKEVCPFSDDTWTASASNVFGARKGDFQWSFWRNGQLVGAFGGINCPVAGLGSSTSTVTFNWGAELGPVIIKVRFLGVNDPFCELSTVEEVYNVNVRVFSPGSISGLQFCSPGQTQTLTIPGIPYSVQACIYHYGYDWFVPAGWSVIPTGGYYTKIPGGIRTHSTSVQLTAPNTTLATGFTGNYNVTVRTEAVWPYPTENTGKIWVGNPTITFVEKFCVGNEAFYKFQAPNITGATYIWSVNNPNLSVNYSNHNCEVSGVPGGSSQSYILRLQIQMGNCTLSKTRSGIYADCAGGGGQLLSVFPNPASDELLIDYLTPENAETMQVDLVNSTFKKVYSIRTNEKSLVVPVRNLPKGIYYLNITTKDGVTKRQVIVEH